MTTSHFDFGARLIEVQTNLGVSSSELARRVGVARQQIGQWRAAKDARVSTVCRVCEGMDITYQEFFEAAG